MNGILVSITLSEQGFQEVKSKPDLQNKEKEFIIELKEENILRKLLYFSNEEKTILILQNIEDSIAKELIEKTNLISFYV